MEVTTGIEVLERLLEACGFKSDSELSRFLGLSSQAVSKARNSGRIPPSWVPQVAIQQNVSTDWLFFGHGAKRTKEIEENKQQTPIVSVSEAACDVDIIMIPMADARLSAGSGSLEVDATSERKYGFRSDFLHRKGSPNDMVLMRVSGDSMSPEIEDNDVVLLDQSKKDITPGRLYAVGFEDAIYLKRIDKLPGKIVLKSTNKDYPPVELNINGDCEDLFRVIGRVLWCGREYK